MWQMTKFHKLCHPSIKCDPPTSRPKARHRSDINTHAGNARQTYCSPSPNKGIWQSLSSAGNDYAQYRQLHCLSINCKLYHHSSLFNGCPIFWLLFFPRLHFPMMHFSIDFLPLPNFPLVILQLPFLPREAVVLTWSWDRNSVCLSVTRVLCDEIIEHTADILIPHERVIILVFWYQRRLVGDVPFHLQRIV